MKKLLSLILALLLCVSLVACDDGDKKKDAEETESQETKVEIAGYYRFVRMDDDGEITTAKDVEDWDSLSHITLVAAVEDEFRMKFSMKEVVEMKNVGEMVTLIAARRKR